MEALTLFAVVFLVASAVGVVLSLVPLPAWAVVAAQVAAGIVVGSLL